MQVMEERTADLQRQLMLMQSELKAVKEDAQIQDLDKACLHTQLTGVRPAAACLRTEICLTDGRGKGLTPFSCFPIARSLLLIAAVHL